MHWAHLAGSTSVLAVSAAFSISQKLAHLVPRFRGLLVTSPGSFNCGLCRKSRSSGLLNLALRHVYGSLSARWWPRAG